MSFNPNELVLEKIRAVEEYNPTTMELEGRYTQIEQPSLQTSATGTQVTDAMGAEIVTFYNAQQGTFSFTNSLHSLDLMASQFGSKKEIAGEGDTNTIKVPVSEIVEIKNNVATLSYVPVGTEGAEVKYAKVINENNTFGKTYTFTAATNEEADNTSSDATAAVKDVFIIDAKAKTLTFPEGTEGRVFVQYERESKAAVRVTKKTDGMPEIKTLIIHAIFHDPCDTNIIYSGVIYVPRAQINPESVEISLAPDGKHAAEYRLQKSYCDENAKLFEIIVSEK